MKSTNEMVENLLERREKYYTERQNKIRNIKRATPVLACCLVVLLGAGAWLRVPSAVGNEETTELQDLQDLQETVQESSGDNSSGDSSENNLVSNGGNTGERSPENSGENEESSKNNNGNGNIKELQSNPGYITGEEKAADKLVVNEVESMASADMDVQIDRYNDKLPPWVWREIVEEFEAFTGIAYEEFTSGVTDTWEITHFYSLSTRGYKDANLQEEYRLHDYVFDCRAESGGTAVIALCSFEEPLRDCFIMCDNPQQSEINGVPLMIYGYNDAYMVQFSFGNVNYDIGASEVTLEELQELLTQILKVSDSAADAPADANGDYREAVDSNDLPEDISAIFGGSYLDDSGNFTVVLTEDTAENRAAVCKELGLKESNTVFKTGVYTLAYLTELQAKISDAMMKKELPFVISSGVYETVNRIKVTVTTEDSDALAKLKALDTIGGAIEMEYSSAAATKELGLAVEDLQKR